MDFKREVIEVVKGKYLFKISEMSVTVEHTETNERYFMRFDDFCEMLDRIIAKKKAVLV